MILGQVVIDHFTEFLSLKDAIILTTFRLILGKTGEEEGFTGGFNCNYNVLCH